MGFLNVAKNVLTLGGHGRLTSALEAHATAHRTHLQLHRRSSLLRGRLDFRIDLLGRTTLLAMKRLHRSARLLHIAAGYPLPRLRVTVDPDLPGLGRIATAAPATALPSSVRIAGGAAVGYAASTGAWALMTMAGTASTGTALSSLSGVAAYNATLAAFGGGSLAAGGAGMAAGAWALAGIAAIPALAFAAWSTHSKANEVNADRQRIEEANEALGVQIQTIKSIGTTSEQARHLLLQAWSVMEQRDRMARRLLWPWGLFSRVKRALLKRLGGGRLTLGEVATLARLREGVEQFNALFLAAGGTRRPMPGDPARPA